MIESNNYETMAVTAVLPRVKVALLQPQFPTLYIVAPKQRGMTVYPVEKAPAWAFDAWCVALTGNNIVYDLAAAVRILHIDRSRWEVYERYQMINELAESLDKIHIRLPLYSSRIEAHRMLVAMEVPK